jgi:hypothetical protein
LPQLVLFQVSPLESLVVQSYFQLQAFFEWSPTQVGICFASSRRSNIIQTPLCSSTSLFMCGFKVRRLVLTHPTTPAICLFLAHFITTLWTRLGLPHPMVVHLSWCQCGHTIESLSIHLFWCFFKSEDIITHDTLQNIIATIGLESEAHVQNEVSHFFSHHT